MKLLSKSELKQSFRNNRGLWMIMTGVVCFFVVVMTAVMPGMIDSGGAAGQGRPGGMGNVTMLEMYRNMIFGMMGIILMLIYAIATGNKLVVNEVDRGTMSFTLNTPVTRRQVIFSKALFYIVSLVTMCVTIGLVASGMSALMGVGLDYGKFWLLISGFTLYGLAVSGICFAASCWFDKSGQALMIGAGLPVAFFVLNSLSSLDGLGFLKYFSLNTLFDTAAVVSGGSFAGAFIAMFAIAMALYIAGINKFLKKDLPL
ncbi:MAG: ABC transporter permease [Dehalococcoidia bacterium]|nr:ABC transporter permease [Dehalococcoidia bacterium]